MCQVFQWKSSFTSAALHETGKRLPESVCLCSTQWACCMPVWTRTLTEMHFSAFPDKKKNKFQKIFTLVPTCQFVSSSFLTCSCRPTRTGGITLSSCSWRPICSPPAPGHLQALLETFLVLLASAARRERFLLRSLKVSPSPTHRWN